MTVIQDTIMRITKHYSNMLCVKKKIGNNKMPKNGDTFITTLKKAYLEWGTHRYTSSIEIEKL
jgi:hypothetical protein